MKEIDWDAVENRYRDSAESAETVEAFSTVIRRMLAELEDLHVWIELPNGKTIHPYSSRYQANYHYPTLMRHLEGLKQFDNLGFTGRVPEGYGVVAVTGLPTDDDHLYKQLIDATTDMFDAPGFIVDLRSNRGGSETRAAQIAGLFAEKEQVYARSKIRTGPKTDEFRERPMRRFGPNTSAPFLRPVVCLIGPGCVSSGEGFALMMKAMDHVTLVGLPTRGASGNPRPVTLSNGVRVWFSRWVSMEIDGTPIEGRGILPDIAVEHLGTGDPTFERAIKVLDETTAE